MMQTLLKAGGMVLILFCTTSIGMALAHELLRRVEHLEMAVAMLDAFEGEISYSLSPPDEIAGRLEQRESLSDAAYLPLCSSLCRQGVPFPEAWKQAVARQPGSLSGEDAGILSELSDTLGQFDLETQLSQIRNIRVRLQLQLEGARTRCQGYARLYRTMGLLSGAFLVIILI